MPHSTVKLKPCDTTVVLFAAGHATLEPVSVGLGELVLELTVLELIVPVQSGLV